MPFLSRAQRARSTAVAHTAALLAAASCLVSLPAFAETRPEPSAPSYQAAESAPGPLLIVVSISRQRLTVFDRSGALTRSPISSGQPDFPTPTGIFSVIGKEIEHESNLYEGAPMPFMQRLTWSGTAMHAGQLPGYPASHGCIRLPYNFSKKLYDMTAINTRVIVTHDDVAPEPFSHPLLPKPLPGDSVEPVVSALPSKVASLNGLAPLAVTQSVAANQLPLTAKAKARFVATARLFEAIKPAEAARAAMWERVKAANVALMSARRDAEAARNAVAVAEDAAEANRLAKRAAEAKLAQVMRKAERRLSPEAIDALAKTEDAAEQTLIEESDKLDAALEQVDAARAGLAPFEAKIAEAEAARRALDNDMKAAVMALRDAQGAYTLSKREDVRYMKPVSVFISRKDQRLYVRQGFDPVLEVPVTIQNPEIPLGTHLFTAMGVKNGDLEWSVVSFPSATRSEETRRAKARVASPAASAGKALERVSYPQESLDAIREIVRPGSSLIISDDGLSEHFGSGTDFVVAVR